MTSLERLNTYYPFDDEVISRVGEAAERQNRHSFVELAEEYDVADGPQTIPAEGGNKAFEVLTIKPKQDYDHSQARIYHLPIALPVDENMTMRGLRLFEADPSKQLLLIGNPGPAGKKNGKLRLHDIQKVWHGDLNPVVDPFLSHLGSRGIHQTDELGFSYGADKAAASAARAIDHDIEVHKGVWMETVATTKRGPGVIGLSQLALDFVSAGQELDNYVQACDSPPLIQAREKADEGLLRYVLGLGRLSNLAIENALAHTSFENRARAALTRQPELQAKVVWGTASELADHDIMTLVTDRLQGEFGLGRVESFAMNGMHHAGGDDIDLHAAIVLQALKS